MLGRCPRPFLHRSTSKSRLTQNHEDEKPVLQPPHQIVIGFDLGAESSKSLHTRACESPRSVLEPRHLYFRVHRQQSRSPRSSLSALRSSLSDSHRNPEGAGLCLNASIKADEEAAGSVDAYHKLLERERVAQDDDGENAYNAVMKNDTVAACKRGSLRTLQNHLWNGRPGANLQFKTMLSSYRDYDYDYDYEYDNDEDEDDDEDIDVDSSKCIFSTASPISNYSMSDFPAVDFLSKCFLCRRHLVQGKDIFMYRGDRAFCSQECRYQQIVVDERKERGPAADPFFSRASSQHRSMRRAMQATVA